MTPGSLTDLSAHGLTACHTCDLLYQLAEIEPGEQALCTRCGAVLYRRPSGGVDRPLALASTAMLLFVIANLFPFLALSVEGRMEQDLVSSGVLALWDHGRPALAVLVGLTSVVFPFITIASLLWLLLPRKLGMHAPATAHVMRLWNAIGPWTLLGVFMLGALVAFVKLQDIATVVPGVSMYAFAGLIACTTGAVASFDVSLIWPRVGPPPFRALAAGATAHEHGLVTCHACALLVNPGRQHGAHGECPRCGSPLHGSRKHDSLMRTWALLISAALLIIPANLYPIMTVIRLGQGEPSTILSGIVTLIAEDLWGLALIVFVASIVVPVLKLALLSYLLVSVQRRSAWRPRERTRLYRMTEVVGAWSMVDIFLVSILTALVSLDRLATITPDTGATFFAAVVVLTMFAAHSFDARLIWDHAVRRS